MCPSDLHTLRSAAAARSAFDVLDADRDGKISRDDLKAFYSSSSFMGPTAAADDEVISSMFSAADADRSGFVDFDEFERVVAPATRKGLGIGFGSSSAIVEEAFWVMDRDGDGRVGFADLKAYLDWAGMGVGDEDVRAMMQMGGGDESEGIGLEGFVKILGVGLHSAK